MAEMSKSPEEIKKDLAAWGTGVRIDIGCGEFVPPTPEYMLNGVRSADVCRDALALIQQLEADNAKKDETIQMLQDGNASLMKMIDEECEKTARLERERDAAVEDMKKMSSGRVGVQCGVCKHRKNGSFGRCERCMNFDSWEWRGVQEKEEEHEADSD